MGSCRPRASGGFVEAGGDAEGVDGVDGVEEFRGGRGFVRLQRTDEVDFEVVESGGWGSFGLPLLHAVFAEEALAGGVGLEEEVDGVHLADGHKGYVGDGAVGAVAGVGDFVADAFQVLAMDMLFASYGFFGADEMGARVLPICC